MRYVHEGAEQELECDVVAGCDGFHGVSRPSIPAGVLRTFARDYPYGWLGIIAAVAPSHDELIYAHTERGFAAHLAFAERRQFEALALERHQPTDITRDDFQRAADGSGLSLDQATKNMTESLSKIGATDRQETTASQMSDQFLSLALAFAGAAVLASLADTLMPEAFEHGRPLNAFATAGGFFLSFVC